MKKMLIGAVISLLVASFVWAESEAINPIVVKTRRVVAYGNDPIKIGSTEFTESQLSTAVSGTSSSVLLSNAVLKVYGSNMVIKTGGSLTVAGYNAMVGSEKWMIQKGLATNTEVITFSPTFVGEPTVICAPTGAVTIVPYCTIGTITGTNATMVGDAGEGLQNHWVAIGVVQ